MILVEQNIHLINSSIYFFIIYFCIGLIFLNLDITFIEIISPAGIYLLLIRIYSSSEHQTNFKPEERQQN